MSARRAWRGGLILIASLLVPIGPGRGETPEIIELRAPSTDAVGFFPEGSQLRLLPYPEFADLRRRALEASRSLSKRGRPVLIRARHSARWDEGVLEGRSELVVQGPASPGDGLALSPWSPAIDPAGTQLEVRTSPEGRNDLWIERTGQFTTIVSWKLRARPGTQGRVFDLALPNLALSRLELDLPEGLLPQISQGQRVESEPVVEPGRHRWAFHGPGGSYNLRILDERADSDETERPSSWIEGPTQIEVHGASATWRSDWTVELPATAPRRLEFSLDPGLRPIGVSGPDVTGFSTTPEGESTRLTVDFSSAGAISSRVQLDALARVPAEGAWRIPAARPLNANWTGGRTRLRVGPIRTVVACRPRAGILVPTDDEQARIDAPDEAVETFVFEGREPGSVAELVFRKTAMEATADVRGFLQLGAVAPRLEATITWTLSRGPLLGLAADLPPNWAADQVQISGMDEPTTWRLAWRDDGGARVIIQPPAYLDPGHPVQATIMATATTGWGPTVEAPRVVPVEARLREESWTAQGEPGGRIRPLESRGLVWVEPQRIPAEPVPGGSADAPEAPSLAWRWIDPDGRLQIERVGPEPRIVAECWTLIRVEPDRLRWDGYLILKGAARDRRTIRLRLSESPDEGPNWHVLGDEVGPPLVFRRVEDQAASEGMATEDGSTWELELPAWPENDRLVLHARWDQPWSGRGKPPIFGTPDREFGRGAVLIFADRSLRPLTTPDGLLRSDRNALRRAFAMAAPEGLDDPGFPTARQRLAQAFEFGPDLGGLDLKTEPLRRAASDGAILEARLIGVDGSSTGRLRRLALQVVPGNHRGLAIRLPEGARLLRCLSDQRRLTPSRKGPDLHFNLPAQGTSRTVTDLVLDFELAESRDETENEWPRFSLPCLSMTREFPLPRSTEVLGMGPLMRSTDPSKADRAARPGPFLQSWSDLRHRDSTTSNQEIPPETRDLFEKVGTSASTLGECLTRLDAGHWPLVIDREALQTAGLDPETPVVPIASPEPASPGLEGFLARFGLVASPIGGAILITTPSDAPDPSTSRSRLDWIASVRQAATRGYDDHDRLQSVVRWRGTPGAGSVAPLGSRNLDPGRRLDRWVSPGGPEAAPSIRLLDGGVVTSLAWTSFWLTLALGLALRRVSPRGRILTLATVSSVGLLGIGLARGWVATLGSGLFIGAFSASAFWLGSAWRGHRRDRRQGRSTASRPRAGVPGSSLGSLLILIAILGPIASRIPFAAEEGVEDSQRPILVVLPFEGDPETGRVPDKALMRLQDFERLEALANSKPAADLEGPWTIRAEHQVDRLGEQEARVVSDYLIRTGPGAGAGLLVPLGNAREIRTWVDDTEVHVRIVPGASHADLRLPAQGLHRLRVERLAPILPDGLLQLPILPSATATLSVGESPDRSQVTVSGASGPIEKTGGGLVGLLGPSPAIDIRWRRPEPAEPVAMGAVEGLFLWRLEAAGDRLLARLTVRRPEGTPRIRLELEPGLMVRSASFPGWSEARWTGPADRPVWEATVSPPLADGETIQLEFWRPRRASAPDGREARSLPHVVPLEVEAYSGIIAIQRPDFWSADFEPATINDPILEDLFLRSWGPVPGPREALAGALSWAETRELRGWVRPAEPRLTLQPLVQLDLSQGRADVRIETTCSDPSGRLRELRVELPEGLRILRVEAEGLSSWSRDEPHRLQIRFTRAIAESRAIRIEGWIPVPPGPNSTGSMIHQMELPWPTWPGAEVESARIAISAMPMSPFQVEESHGLTILRAPAPDENAVIHALYGVSGTEPSARIRWPGEITQADVTLRSHLEFHPDSVEWLAQVRYRVTGGPSRSIQLDLPTSWVDLTEVRFEPGKARIQRESHGARSILTIEPEAPIWGASEVELRARKPWTSQTLDFPDLIPLGYGRISDALLAWVDLSGRELTAEGSAGLQQVAAARFGLPGLPVPDQPDRKVYQVLRDRWSLRIRANGERPPQDHAPESRRVRLADVACNLADDGTVTGQARYLLSPGEEPFLTLRIPEGLEPLAATVDGALVTPWLQPGGPLLIPLGESSPSRVTLLWLAHDSSSELSWPGPVEPGFPTLLTVHASPRVRLRLDGGPLVRVSGASLEVERLEQRTQALLDSLGRFDRSSPRERAMLVSSLERLELQSRSASRMVRWSQPDDPNDPAVNGGRLLGRLKASDALRSRALGEAGLEGFLHTARVRVGADLQPEPSTLTETADDATDPRIRRLGRPTYFQGLIETAANQPRLHWSLNPGAASEPPMESRATLLIAVLMIPAAWIGLAWRARPVRLVPLLATVCLIVFPWLGLAPLGLGCGLGMFGVGWLHGRDPVESPEPPRDTGP